MTSGLEVQGSFTKESMVFPRSGRNRGRNRGSRCGARSPSSASRSRATLIGTLLWQTPLSFWVHRPYGFPLPHTYHHVLLSLAINNRRKPGTGVIVPSRDPFARARAIVEGRNSESLILPVTFICCTHRWRRTGREAVTVPFHTVLSYL